MTTKQSKRTPTQTKDPKRPIIKLELAQIIEPTKTEQEFGSPEIEGYESEEVASDLTPTVDFHSPGTYIHGAYLGYRTLKLRNRQQVMYDLKIPDTGEVVSVWGSTILDNRMQRAGFSVGENIFIQYLGTIETDAGQNPAKNYKIGRLKTHRAEPSDKVPF